MEIITQNFTYDQPDIYMGNTTDDGLTGTVSYHGPDEMWVFVNSTTGKLNWGMHCIINHDDTSQDLARTHAGEDHTAILVSFNQNPLICWAMWGEYDEENASEKTFTLDGEDEPYFRHFDPIPPHEIYNYDEFTYLFDNAAWRTPYPMVSPQITQEQFESILDEMLEDVQEKIDAEDVNAEFTTQMTTFKSEVEAIRTKFEATDVPYYMWPMPDAPEIDRDGDIDVLDEAEEAARRIGDVEEWTPAEDGSEGAGPETNYQPPAEEGTQADEEADYPDSESNQPDAPEPPEPVEGPTAEEEDA